jgi:hypothetical protein
MALPASGLISMSMVRTELQNDGKTSDLRLSFLGSMSGSGATRTSGYVPINQSSLTKPSSLLPASLSEWYSYDHNTDKACGNPLNLTLGGYYTYTKYQVTGLVGSTSTTTMFLPTNPGGNTIKCQIFNNSYPFTNLGTLTGTPTPAFNGTFTDTSTQTYNFNLTSTSHTLYVVAWDDTVSPGNYSFFVNPSCGTTSTTTTLPPLVVTNGTVTCSGNSGSFTSTFSGGSGTYVSAALDTQPSNVISLLNGGAGSAAGRLVILSPGATSNTWNNVGSGSWFTGVKDSANAIDTEAVSINCTTTTTTTTSTTTTTTTAAPTYTVRFFVKYNANSPVSGAAFLDYSTDGTNYTPRVSINSSTCTNTPFTDLVNITAGTTIYIRTVEEASSADIRYNAVTGSTCPSNLATYCAGGFSTVINANTDIAVNVYMDKARQYSYC